MNPTAREMLNKVPEVTLYFWVIKMLCTTVGETASDYLNDEPRPRPDEDDVHHRRAPDRDARRPVPRCGATSPPVYWLGVVLISVVGTLITDNLTDNFGVSLVTTTIVFCDRPRDRLRGLVRERAHALDPHDLHHPARGASTGSRSSSPSRSAPRPATSPPSGSTVGYAWSARDLRRRRSRSSPLAHYRFA